MQKLLSEYRKEAGFRTQKEFSITIGVERATVARWEIGERYPRPIMLPKIAEILGITEGEIIAAIMEAKNKNITDTQSAKVVSTA